MKRILSVLLMLCLSAGATAVYAANNGGDKDRNGNGYGHCDNENGLKLGHENADHTGWDCEPAAEITVDWYGPFLTLPVNYGGYGCKITDWRLTGRGFFIEVTCTSYLPE